MKKDIENGIKTLRIPQLGGSFICVDYLDECVNMPGFKEALNGAILKREKND